MRQRLGFAAVLGVLCALAPVTPAVAQTCSGGTWAPIDSINTARSRTGVAFDSVTGHFFLAGGEATGGNRAIPIEEYDPGANTWTNRANLLTGVSNTGVAAVGGFVYVPGGYNGTTGVTNMQRFDPATNNVTNLATMPAGNYAHAVAARGNFIHVLGGSSTGVAGTTHFVYDIAGNSWATAAAVPVAVQYPAAASDGTLVYLLGGNTTNITNVQVYNPGTNTWSAGTPMNIGRGGPGAFFAGTQLWAVGGGWTSYLASTEYFDAGSWTAGPSLNTGARTIGVGFGNLLAVKAGGWNGAYLAAAEALTCTGGACTIIPPADITQSNDPAQCGAVVTYPAPGGTCTGVTCVPASGSFFPIGTTTVTCTDATGGTSETFDVTVNDDELPAITCPPDIAAELPPGSIGQNVDFPDPTVSDNCPGVAAPSCVPASGDFFPAGETSVLCDTIDAAGNVNSCNFLVTLGAVTVLEVPTVSSLGLLALALLLAAAAFVVLRRNG